jgi:hypothetical protein
MYFYLTTFWGDVPWVGEVIQPEDAYIERTPREKVIDQLVEDLKWAAERMPEERYTGDKTGKTRPLGRFSHIGTYCLAKRKVGTGCKNSEYIIENSPYACMNMKSYFITKEMSRMIRKISKPSYIAFLY